MITTLAVSIHADTSELERALQNAANQIWTLIGEWELLWYYGA